MRHGRRRGARGQGHGAHRKSSVRLIVDLLEIHAQFTVDLHAAQDTAGLDLRSDVELFVLRSRVEDEDAVVLATQRDLFHERVSMRIEEAPKVKVFPVGRDHGAVAQESRVTDAERDGIRGFHH